MKNIYYTATTGKRNINGHTTTRGTVYIINGETLESIGNYKHQSGGADITDALLWVCQEADIDVGGGYYGNWSEFVRFYEIGKEV